MITEFSSQVSSYTYQKFHWEKAGVGVRSLTGGVPYPFLSTALTSRTQSINQSIKVFLEWPKWRSRCKVHYRCTDIGLSLIHISEPTRPY